MKTEMPKLLLTSSPFLKQAEDTAHIMRQVTYSLFPVVAASIYYFGWNSLLIVSASIGGAIVSEWWLGSHQAGGLRDGSAVLTGLLLALTLPPGIPLWMAFLGGCTAIILGKLIFGGIGGNVFNPALVGRAFLQAAFPVAITTWIVPDPVYYSGFSENLFLAPFSRPAIDAASAATPLADMKFEKIFAGTTNLFWGNSAGSLGETSVAAIIAGGMYLAWRNYLNWRIPLSIFLTVLLLSGIFHYLAPTQFAPPLFHLFAGGLMLGAVYMATDPVTSPITQSGCWIFGAGIGILVIIIRNFGGLPEGVMYAILLMNAATPLINSFTQPKIYGERTAKNGIDT